MIPKCKKINQELENVDGLIQNIDQKRFRLIDREGSIDFNAFTKSGYYQCNFQKGANAPHIYATGMLLVFGSYYISQLYIANLNNSTTVYVRMSTDKGSSWLEWKQLA